MQALDFEYFEGNPHASEQRAAQYLRQREKDLQGLNEPVLRSGFLTFAEYEQKLRMMDHPLYLFGMKLHEMPDSVEFFDADFCNTLVVKSEQFENLPLSQVARLLNKYLN